MCSVESATQRNQAFVTELERVAIYSPGMRSADCGNGPGSGQQQPGRNHVQSHVEIGEPMQAGGLPLGRAVQGVPDTAAQYERLASSRPY